MDTVHHVVGDHAAETRLLVNWTHTAKGRLRSNIDNVMLIMQTETRRLDTTKILLL